MKAGFKIEGKAAPSSPRMKWPLQELELAAR